MPFRTLIAALVAFLSVTVAFPIAAGEQEDAAAAAKETMNLLASTQFETLWDKHTSQHLKKNLQRDQFLGQMMIGRASFGNLKESAVLKSSFTDNDGSEGFKGRSFGVTYLNTYASGKFYERIVLVKDPDGKFRFAGTQAMPVPKAGMPASGEEEAEEKK